MEDININFYIKGDYKLYQIDKLKKALFDCSLNEASRKQNNVASSHSAVGDNPYKGLLAFQETDGDRFFGRDLQIQKLWERFRILHESDSALRILPILGPSGSGKSSLVTAGLIPKLARQPLPGQDRVRIGVFLPGIHPLEALATILARIATGDQTPVAKTREFALELDSASSKGEYDGLRRIADVLPDIDISPLILVIDQLEEIYTLCKNPEEQSKFIHNLLCAAVDSSKRVTVIVTMRSDFFGETQKEPLLNRQISEQGFLVPAMNKAELQEAIAKPAEQAGFPLDGSITSLLIEQSIGRQGVLPLLQFALERIWEGVKEDISPAVTLQKIGGVGGALARKAQEIFESLTSHEKDIAQRIFVSLVHLGDGTRDTRRRVKIRQLVTTKDSLAQVKKIIDKFSSPSARLITLSSSDGDQVAEVTHEALLDNWAQLKLWLEGRRDLIRQQRKIEESAEEWRAHGDNNNYLLEGGQLKDARRFRKRYSDTIPLSNLTETFLHESYRKKLITLGRNIVLFVCVICLITIIPVEKASLWKSVDDAQGKVYSLARNQALEKLVKMDESLARKNFNGMNLSGIDLNRADLDAAVLSNSDLSHANLGSSNMRSANLGNSDLSHAFMMYANLSNANLSGADLSDATLNNAVYTAQTTFPKSFIVKNHEMYLIGPNAKLNKALLSGMNLMAAELNNSNLSNAILSNTDLKFAKLNRADLTGAKMLSTKLWGADLSFSKLTRAELIYSNLNFSNLTNADMREVNFYRADLWGADLKDAILSHAQNLTPAQVKSASNWEQAVYDAEFCMQLKQRSCRTK